MQQRIRQAFDRLVAAYRRDDQLVLPVVVKVASSRKA